MPLGYNMLKNQKMTINYWIECAKYPAFLYSWMVVIFLDRSVRAIGLFCDAC
jgi:hypothetical protein